MKNKERMTAIRGRFISYLVPDEHILWAGKPIAPNKLAFWYGIQLCLFMVFWLTLFSLLSPLHILINIILFFVTFQIIENFFLIFDKYVLNGHFNNYAGITTTKYAVTKYRVLILKSGQLYCFWLHELALVQLHERNIFFGIPYKGFHHEYDIVGFYDIDEAPIVYHLIWTRARQARERVA